jgi:pyruvate/2-oxoglutarate dehydrogenase complex dihydrolipoamide dehydrogenase (E3) component
VAAGATVFGAASGRARGGAACCRHDLRKTLPDPARVRADVLIIGAGQAGVPLAARLAEAGRRVVLVERARLGGTCVNYGCTPTKTMVASARAAHVARTAGRLGVHAGGVTVDFGAVVARKEKLVEQWRASVRKRLDQAGERLTVVRGHARFTGPRAVRVDGDATYDADVVVVNVGARAAVPEIDGLDDVPWLDNAGVMELDRLPGHLLVIGGGFVGCEFAQMFRRFGADVTLIEPGDHLLGREDGEVSEAIAAVFRDEGVALRLGRRAVGVARAGQGMAVTLDDGAHVEGTHLLVATGRTPNTGDLGCDAAGIACDDDGFITVDDGWCTSAEGVYAAGDVTGGPQFTHVAWDDHRGIYDVLTGRGAPSRGRRRVPHVTYTDPQVAGVGLTEREAKERGVSYELARLEFGKVARAIETDETAGVIRILVDPSTERILGATVVGAEAGELIHVVQALMLADAPARVFVDGQVAHPAFAEGVHTALMQLDRFALAGPDT